MAVRIARPVVAMTRISTTRIPERGDPPAAATNPILTPPRPVPYAFGGGSMFLLVFYLR
jgi:hypothetical protein